ncbi:acyl- --sterol O-acyltransferase 1-like isoform B [Chlorella sorokiniana]|uniref:Acyl---sterol O-acyltransferase 1-like isoform B n=1 Tax=Chlorella sorokiniana TaxID=3076 RepID=A0A2P6TCL8_CHLSO|nr:acyl- --sterol O-acyltransferase 1-like isoform B [Chlorella sorokiniana]|eukprot:PRW20389.1 acyl- --sterol O-acyltransferase 1-like isoform B [Chlorella sorokiniana]
MEAAAEALEELRQLPYAHKMAGVAACTLLQAAWLLRVASHASSPPARLLLTLPVLAANAAIPLAFKRDTEGVTVAFAGFMLAWLANFKSLALAAGRGPLAQQPWSVMQAWVLLVVPIVPASKRDAENPGPPLMLFLRWLLKAAVTAAVVFALLSEPPAFIRSCLYILGIYGMLGVVMDGPAALLLRPLRLQLAPHFRAPWESPSVAAFWGIHWNQAASNALRTTIYDVIVEQSFLGGGLADTYHCHPAKPTANGSAPDAAGASTANGTAPITARRRSTRLGGTAAENEAAGAAAGAAGSGAAAAGAGKPAAPAKAASAARRALQRRRLWGMAACFVASGIAHEIIFIYVTGHTTRWLSWQLFFSGQVALIAAERRLLAWLQQRGTMPRLLVRRAATLAVLMATAHPLFFQPAEVAGVAALFAASMRESFAALAALPAQLLAVC